jgi:anti-sigma-K factor RskA
MSEIHGATGSYVVDALDPDELDEFEAHLAVCPTCRQEVVEFCETAAELALLASAPPPPPALREAVLAGISGVRQLPPEEVRPRRAMVEDDPEPAPAAAPSVVAARDTTAGSDDVVDELALRRSSRRARVLSVLVAAVTVVALALGFTVWSLVRQQQPPVAGPAPTATLPPVDPSLLAAPDAKIIRTKVNGADASFVVSKDQNRAAFVSVDLPPAGVGNVYQLWTLKGDTIVRRDNSLKGGGQAAQVFSGPVKDSTALAINIEPAGTTPEAPTTPVLAAVKI